MILLLDQWLTNNAHPEHKAILSKRHGAILQAAACTGYQEVMKHLLQAGTDINTVIGKSSTVLHIVAYEGHDSLVQMLLYNRASINSTDYHNWTSYTMALMSRQDIICSMLSKYSYKTSAGLPPSGLVKCIPSEVTIYDGEKAASAGWQIAHFIATTCFTDFSVKHATISERHFWLQV